MTLPASWGARIIRLALLEPRIVDIPYGTTGSRVIGYLITPDECWSKNDGFGLLDAIQRKAGIKDWLTERDRVLAELPKD